MSDAPTNRGLRLFNPGNIRISAASWQGKISPSADPEFEQFDSMEHGIRALAKIILTYYDKYHLKNIAGIVYRYAPPSENNTMAYIENVEYGTGIDRTKILDIRNPFTLCKLVRAICTQETGKNGVTSEEVARGVQMALT